MSDSILNYEWDIQDHICHEVKDALFEILKSSVDIVCLELREKRVENLAFIENLVGLFFEMN